jgi:3-oxoacyl-(acyl-carrier-protein) synthase
VTVAAPVVSGLGVVSSIGVGRNAFTDALQAGRSADDLMLRDFDPVPILGRKGLRNLSRESKLLLSAATLALNDAGIEPGEYEGVDLGVFVATSLAGLADFAELFERGLADGPARVNPGQGPQTGFNAPASEVSIRLGAQGPNVTIANGSAGAIDSLGCAARAIQHGEAAIALVAGVDTVPDPAARVLDGDGTRPRPFDRERRGPGYGEAAVVLVLEAPRRREARPLAIVRGVSTAFGAGAGGLEAAAGRSMASCRRMTRDRLGAVFAGANGSVEGDASEARALSALGDVPVSAVKGAVGECFGASAALQLAAAVIALGTRKMPPTVGFDVPDPALPPLRVEGAPLERGQPVLVHAWDADRYSACAVLGPAE